jgi:hypothetical protein
MGNIEQAVMSDEPKSPPKVRIKLPAATGQAVFNLTVPGASTRDEAIAQLLADAEEPREAAYLHAQLAFLIDPYCRPPGDFYELASAHMDAEDYQARVRADRWPAMRERLRATAQRELLDQLSRRIVARQMQEAAKVEALMDHIYEFISPIVAPDGELSWRVQPKSLEGMIRTYRDLAVLLQAYRQAVAQGIEPTMPREFIELGKAGSGPQRGPFAPEETGAMVETVLKLRMSGGEVQYADDEEEEGK